MSVQRPRAGVSVTLRYGSEPEDVLIQPACEATAGQAMCASHPRADTHNNWMANSHFSEPRKHVELWQCHVHGPEEAMIPKPLAERIAEDRIAHPAQYREVGP